jgi:hypothetical protein
MPVIKLHQRKNGQKSGMLSDEPKNSKYYIYDKLNLWDQMKGSHSTVASLSLEVSFKGVLRSVSTVNKT